MDGKNGAAVHELDAAALRRLITEAGATHVMVGVVDLDGALRAKHLAADKVLAGLERRLSFCDVVLGFDSDDVVYENTSTTGPHTGFPDEPMALAPETARPLPGHRPSYVVLGHYAEPPLADICPRQLLRRVLARAERLGFECVAGFEYEFFLFDETPNGVREKDFRNLRPITPGAFAYSAVRSDVWREVYDDILRTCDEMRMPLEGLHAESGPGVVEAAIGKSGALDAADRAVLFKTFVKSLVQRRGLMATFMSRWSADVPGQGGHIHLSLRRTGGSPAFHDDAARGRMSDVMRRFVAGQQALLPELTAMFAPTVNSYTRLVPGAWAPTTATWGIENRTCALRVVPGSPSSQRVEHRVPGADANPYLALAAAIGSGLWGIEQELEPSEPVAGNAYELHGATALPATLGAAAELFIGSRAAAELFGARFVEHFGRSREWEVQQFRRHVTDWELHRYFEGI
jgi:glutamine synthetase